jgi:hypothetical protein
MRHRFACMAAFSLCALATRTPAAELDCVALELSNSEQIAAAVAQIARTDEAAMQRFMDGAACLDEDARVTAGRAAGEFFDQKPREYLKLIATVGAKDISWLEALIFAPERIHSDPVARIGVFARRAEVLQANADLIAPEKYKYVMREFQRQIEGLASNIGKRFPEPLVMIDPLTGIELDAGSARIEPVSPDWMPMTKLAQGPDWRVFGDAGGTDAGGLYLLISGFSFEFSPDGSAIEGVGSDEGWVENVDIRDNRVEVLAAASELFTSPRIPRNVAVALCQNTVDRLSRALGEERLQRALDERLRREPDAGFVKPLRDAFIKARFDVKRYREIAVPGTRP